MSYWYCPNCKIELDGCHVTYQEICEYCGTAVLSVPENISQERAEELFRAEAEGRLVVLPVKVGSTIYRLEAPQYSWEIVSTTIYLDETIFTDDSDNIIKETDIGKTVFLTREDAEKALDKPYRAGEGDTCKVTNQDCAGCNPVCEHRGDGEG